MLKRCKYCGSCLNSFSMVTAFAKPFSTVTGDHVLQYEVKALNCNLMTNYCCGKLYLVSTQQIAALTTISWCTSPHNKPSPSPFFFFSSCDFD